MNVSILGTAARRERLGRILHIDIDESSSAGVVSWLSPHCHGIVELLVDNDIVRSSDWEIVKETCQVGPGVKSLGAARAEVEQLAHVEDLNVMVHGLGADDEVVAICLDFTPAVSSQHTSHPAICCESDIPNTSIGSELLRQSSQVLQLSTLLIDLSKRHTIRLSNGSKLSPAVYPSPASTSSSLDTTKLSVRGKVIVIHIFASESLQRIAWDDLGDAVLAFDDLLLGLAGPFAGVIIALGLVGAPLRLMGRLAI